MARGSVYRSDIKLGEKYRDRQTGFEGHAVAVYFYEHACERVEIKALVDGEIKSYVFDALELESVKTGVRATSTRTGGPHDRTPVTR